MKDKTIIILKDICGEYDDSMEFIVSVYIIDKPNFDLQMEFCKYLMEFYGSHGLEALIMGDEDNRYVCLRYLLYEYRKEYKGRYRELNRKLREIEKNHKGYRSIQNFVENTLKLEKLENIKEVYIN
jgi:hypothetical protein